METVYLNLAKSIIGQCEVGNVDVVVVVSNGMERELLIDTIAALQHNMHFEGFKHGTTLTLFGRKVNIILNTKGAANRMKLNNKRVFALE